MQTKISLAVVAAAVIAAGAYIWYARDHTPADTAPLTEEFTWSFIDRGVVSSTPQTDVGLSIAGVNVPLGTFAGTCTALAGSSWPFLAGEISGAVCMASSTGTEIGVFEERGKLILKEGTIAGGDAASPGQRSNFIPLTKQPSL